MPKHYFILSNEKILLIKDQENYHLPKASQVVQDKLINEFALDDYYACAALDQMQKITTGEWIPLKEAYLHLGEKLFQLAGRARQLLDWRIDHRFCGRCGESTEFFDEERAKKCPACDLINYPRISPCVMVAIKREDEILLARSPHFPKGLFSVLAGFIEPGESAEACVHREVYEEVGLKIKNLQYLASQPWPFPGQLMLGFTAEYLSGEITIDGIEIEKAKWFRKDELPLLPKPFSLSFQLVQHLQTMP